MSTQWTRRDMIRAMALGASAPVLASTGCDWQEGLQRERASEWLTVVDARGANRDSIEGQSPNDDALTAVLDRITLVPHHFADVSRLDAHAVLFGQTMYEPIVVGAHPSYTGTARDEQILRGAQAAGATAVIGESGFEGGRAGDRVGPDPWILADSVTWDPVRTMERASVLGARAIVLPVASRATGARRVRALSGSGIPVLVSGVAGREAALDAMDAGARAVVLNDERRAPILILEEVADAVGRRIPVLISNGFVGGEDILKALALGAAAVLVDRPVAWGLAAAGAPGVRRVVEILQQELAYAMGMSGVSNPAAISRSLVRVHAR